MPNHKQKQGKSRSSPSPSKNLRSRSPGSQSDLHSSQSGGGYNTLTGQNLPFFYENSGPKYFNNQMGWTDTGLQPYYTGHGTVGQGHGKGLNYGQAHYGLNMSGGADEEEEAYDQVLDDIANEFGLDFYDDETSSDDQGDSQTEEDNQSGGGPTPLPLRWFNPSGSPVISPISGNHPSLTMVGGSCSSYRDYEDY